MSGLTLPGAQATNTDGGGSGTVFVPIVPCRLFDTRPAPDGVGLRKTPLNAGETFAQAVTGTNGACTAIPAQATGVSMNVTVANPSQASFLTLWPADAAQPLASNLNWTAGQSPTPNKVDVKLSATGSISMFNNAGMVDVIADVVGYYVDHNHDDRYYTKAQVDSAVAGATSAVSAIANAAQKALHHDLYPAWSMTLSTSTTVGIGTINGCLTNYLSGSTTGHVPVIVPIGARLISVDVVAYDGGSTDPYTVQLIRSVVGSIGLSFDVIGSASGGTGSNVTTHHVITPSSTEIADANRSYSLEFPGLKGTNNGFCSAQLTYDTNG